MTKIKSGLIFIAIGIGLNISGRIAATVAPGLLASLLIANALAFLMVASVVVVLFGIFRLVVGLVARKKQTSTSPAIVVEDAGWPPAPKPPGSAK